MLVVWFGDQNCKGDSKVRSNPTPESPDASQLQRRQQAWRATRCSMLGACRVRTEIRPIHSDRSTYPYDLDDKLGCSHVLV